MQILTKYKRSHTGVLWVTHIRRDSGEADILLPKISTLQLPLHGKEDSECFPSCHLHGTVCLRKRLMVREDEARARAKTA